MAIGWDERCCPTYILSFWCCRFPMAAKNLKESQQTIRLWRLRFLNYFRSSSHPVPEVGIRHSGNCGFQVPSVRAKRSHLAKLRIDASE